MNDAEPDTAPALAVIVVVPAATALPNPEALMVAIPVLEEVQVTELVMFTVVPSVKLPVAVNCCVVPVIAEPFPGVIWIELRLPSTSSGVLPLTVPDVAVIVAVP